MSIRLLLVCTLLAPSAAFITSCSAAGPRPNSEIGRIDAEGFMSIFNGRDLTGWTPKVAGHELGDNVLDTFVAKDGILSASYDRYDTFDGRFAHLFYEQPFSHYILRMDYRFVGEQCPDTPVWAFINSGVMLHSQSPQSMSIGQEFPISVEAQTLGVPEGDTTSRPTGNVCTPGTFVVYDGQVDHRHCIESSSPTYQGDQWVALEMEVHGHDRMIFRINGETVLEFEQPQLDPADGRDNHAAQKLIDARGGNTKLSDGYIALQAEGAPLQFRNLRIKTLR